MQAYVFRLYNCGFSMAAAYTACCDFIKNFDYDALEDYVRDVESARFGV